MKRTPLYEAHARLGARLVEFGGWEMPVFYTSIVEEHQAVRTAAGLFDISHMGEIEIQGPGAGKWLNGLLTNDLSKARVGQGQYTFLCNASGGVVDDLYAYRFGANEYLLMVNASRIEADFAWLQSQWSVDPAREQTGLHNRSDETAALAVQGPRVVEFIDECFPEPSDAGAAVKRASELRKNQVARFPSRNGPVWAARTGYTGEDGFELIAPASEAAWLWERVLARGARVGIKPAGLGARDTLRTEMGYPLYGHELNEQTTPIEAGLGFFVAMDKGEFIGRAVLAGQKAQGTKRKLAAFRMTGRSAPPRPGYPIFLPGATEPVGQVASGTQSPSLGVGIGMGFVLPEAARPGTDLDIEARGNRWPAAVVPRPIYRKPVDQTKTA